MLDILRENDIHLILLDIMMPVMDGITAISKIREFSNVPIILLTAKSETEDLVLGLNVGADDYMVKPLAEEEMLLRVASLLRRAKIATLHAKVIGFVHPITNEKLYFESPLPNYFTQFLKTLNDIT